MEHEEPEHAVHRRDVFKVMAVMVLVLFVGQLFAHYALGWSLIWAPESARAPEPARDDLVTVLRQLSHRPVEATLPATDEGGNICEAAAAEAGAGEELGGAASAVSVSHVGAAAASGAELDAAELADGTAAVSELDIAAAAAPGAELDAAKLHVCSAAVSISRMEIIAATLDRTRTASLSTSGLPEPPLNWKIYLYVMACLFLTFYSRTPKERVLAIGYSVGLCVLLHYCDRSFVALSVIGLLIIGFIGSPFVLLSTVAVLIALIRSLFRGPTERDIGTLMYPLACLVLDEHDAREFVEARSVHWIAEWRGSGVFGQLWLLMSFLIAMVRDAVLERRVMQASAVTE